VTTASLHRSLVRGDSWRRYLENNTGGSTLRERIRAYELDSSKRRVLGLYVGFGEPCPLRLRLNTYWGCRFACRHCYVWDQGTGTIVRPDRRILKQLDDDLRDYPPGIQKLPVMLSCSTDPMNMMEPMHKTSLYAMRRLREAGFPMIIRTQNPAQLLEVEYLDVLKNATVLIEVTVQSIHAGLDGKGVFRSQAPPARQRLNVLAELSAERLTLRLRLDPIIPRFAPDGPGQSPEDIDQVVAAAARGGAKLVISKCMRLTPDVARVMRAEMKDFYATNAVATRGTALDLRPDVQERLIAPVREACAQHGIAFCTCICRVRTLGSRHCSTGGWGDRESKMY
jgi:DNA repair photolyase